MKIKWRKFSKMKDNKYSYKFVCILCSIWTQTIYIKACCCFLVLISFPYRVLRKYKNLSQLLVFSFMNNHFDKYRIIHLSSFTCIFTFLVVIGVIEARATASTSKVINDFHLHIVFNNNAIWSWCSFWHKFILLTYIFFFVTLLGIFWGLVDHSCCSVWLYICYALNGTFWIPKAA